MSVIIFALITRFSKVSHNIRIMLELSRSFASLIYMLQHEIFIEEISVE